MNYPIVGLVGWGLGSLTFYTAPICPTTTVWDSTSYPNSRSPSSLAWVQRTQASLRPNPHISWPSGLRPSAKTILQCATLLAAGGYHRPCGPIENLFLLSPACILDGRARLYSPEVSYSYFMGLLYGTTATLWDPRPLPRKEQLMDNFFCSQKYL